MPEMPRGESPGVRPRWLIIFASAVLFSFFYNLLRLTGPVFILLVYDRVLPSGSSEALLRLSLYVAIFFLIMGVVDYSRRRILARLGAQFQEDMEKHILETTDPNKLFLVHERKPVSGLNEIDNLRGFAHSGTLIAILDFIWAPIFLGVVFYFHHMLGWTVALGLVGLLALSWLRAQVPPQEAANSRAARAEINRLKDTILTSRGVIKTQGLSPAFIARWLRARRASRDTSIALADWSAWFSVMFRQIRLLLQYAVLAVGAYLVLDKELSVGAMVATMFLSVRVLVPVEQFIQELPAISRARTSWNGLKRLLAGRQYPEPSSNRAESTSGLQLSEVSVKAAGKRERILKSVRLEVPRGAVVAITGPSGSGKTVLAEAILGVCPLSAGQVSFDGWSLKCFASDSGERLFGYLPGSPSLIRGTLEENIAGFESPVDSVAIISAAKRAGVHDLIIGLREGYRTAVNPAKTKLSDGEQYRVCLARILYREPKVMLIDEPDGLVTEGTPSALKRVATAQTDGGRCVLVLSRRPVPGLEPDLHYRIDNGSLTLCDSGKGIDTPKQPKL